MRLGDYFGRQPVVLALAYYECPMLCTQVLNGMTAALKNVSFDAGKDYQVVVISFNPDETPMLAAAKKKTLRGTLWAPAAADGWHFLTGTDARSTRSRTRSDSATPTTRSIQQYAHAAGIMVPRPRASRRALLPGARLQGARPALALVEASANKIGSVVDQILLFCYHYDPATGKYGAAAIARCGSAAC